MAVALTDIGANLADSSFSSDRERVIERAVEHGVTRMVVTGSTVEVSRQALALARRHPDLLWATAGVHPHHAADCDDATIPALRALAAEPELVAIGECGLDYFRDLSPRDVQRHWLEQHLELAAELGMPLFLHERDAAEDMAAILRAHRGRIPRAVVHCFTGQAAALDRYLELDLHIGITGWICDERRGLHLRELVGRIPADRLMIETDAPYLLPRTIRPRPKSRRNEPMYLGHVLAAVAECRGEATEEVAAATTRTAAAFFGLE
jgi:TatD DNase family protein